MLQTTARGARPAEFGQRLAAALAAHPHAPTSTMTVNRHESIYQCGRRASDLFVVVRGRVKTAMYSRNGKESLLAIHASGDVLGELCLLEDTRMESATAMTDATLQRISVTTFREALIAGQLHEEFIRYLARRLHQQQQTINDLVTVDSEQRLGVLLIKLAERLGVPDARGAIRIDERITHEEFAGMVGTTRSRIGLFLKRFRESGAVEARGCGLVVHAERLNDYLDQLV